MAEDTKSPAGFFPRFEARFLGIAAALIDGLRARFAALRVDSDICNKQNEENILTPRSQN